MGSIGGVCVLIGGLGFLWFCLNKKKKNRVENKYKALYELLEAETGPKKYSYQELACHAPKPPLVVWCRDGQQPEVTEGRLTKITHNQSIKYGAYKCGSIIYTYRI